MAQELANWTCPDVWRTSPMSLYPRLAAAGEGVGAVELGSALWGLGVFLAALTAFVLGVAVFWCQALVVNAAIYQMEDFIGVSEAYVRARALEAGVPDLLLKQRNLTPEPVPVPSTADAAAAADAEADAEE